MCPGSTALDSRWDAPRRPRLAVAASLARVNPGTFPAATRAHGIASEYGAPMDGHNQFPGTASYSLKLSEQELTRYRMMAASAADNEAAEWSTAGILPGARIADVGCGPGAILRLLAERIGAEGRAVGIDADPSAVSIARQQTAGLPQVQVQVGHADATGLDPGAYDVVMCRHVLAHNGGREAMIVAHLASLAATGGCVYLVDVDATAFAVYAHWAGAARPTGALSGVSSRQRQRPIRGPAPRRSAHRRGPDRRALCLPCPSHSCSARDAASVVGGSERHGCRGIRHRRRY